MYTYHADIDDDLHVLKYGPVSYEAVVLRD